MVYDSVHDSAKKEKLRLKRNEYARNYRERNKTIVIDDESEEKRIALNLKAKFYRERKKAVLAEQKRDQDASACTVGGATHNASVNTLLTVGISEHLQLICFALVIFILILFRPPSHPIG
jgi:hypothetical protein